MYRSHGWGKDLDAETYQKSMEDNNVDPFHQPFTFFEPGYNLRSTDLQAYLGILQIEKADYVTYHRNRNHKVYARELKDFTIQQYGDDYPVSISFGCLAKDSEHRKRIVTALVEAGVETRIFSAGNLARHPFWINTKKNSNNILHENGLQMANKIHERGFFLPNYPELKERDIEFICSIVKSIE